MLPSTLPLLRAPGEAGVGWITFETGLGPLFSSSPGPEVLYLSPDSGSVNYLCGLEQIYVLVSSSMKKYVRPKGPLEPFQFEQSMMQTAAEREQVAGYSVEGMG